MKILVAWVVVHWALSISAAYAAWTNAAEPLGVNAGVYRSSIQWGDYDNDGDLDLAVSGHDGTNRRLIIYRNNGGGSFTNVAEPMGANAGLEYSSIQWGDYDNDGDIDLAVSGQDGSGNRRLIIYRNDGGTFTNAAEPMGANAGVDWGSIQWADYDNDGDLDLAVSGNYRLIVYRNNGGGTFTNVAEPMGVNIGVSYSSIQWGDYDNDGDLDLAVSGRDMSLLIRLRIYRNDGGGSFTNVAEPMGAGVGVRYSSIQWGDYDNDGDLDLGVSGDTDFTFKPRLVIFRSDGNATPNVQPPSPVINYPKGTAFVQGDTVTFRWTKISGDTTPDTGITYNLRVGTASGKCDVFAADTNNADSIGNTILGNAQNDTSAVLVKSLAFGTYYWSVQAVDGGMMRSAWTTEETFSIRPPFAASIVRANNHQLCTALVSLSKPFEVICKDGNGNVIIGATVTFGVSYLPIGATSYSIDTTISTTTSSGTAAVRLTPGNKNGIYQVTATSDAVSETFTAYTDAMDITAGKWKMGGPNKKPDTPTLVAVIEDDGFGTRETTGKGTLASGYRIWRWDPTAGVDADFSRFVVPSIIELGKSYWFKSASAGVLDVDGTAQTETFQLRLEPGWNMVANPFPHFIDWDSDVRFETFPIPADTSPMGGKKTPAQAKADSIAEDVTFWYEEGAPTLSGYRWGPRSISFGAPLVTSLQIKPN